MLHSIFATIYVHLAKLFVGVLALIIFGFDPLPICSTCFVQAGNGVYAHDLPRITQAHALQCLPLYVSTSSTHDLGLHLPCPNHGGCDFIAFVILFYLHSTPCA
jgi:hypothetical protein